jgi:SPP1 gp7 family putative phage head morphogenesis protein
MVGVADLPAGTRLGRTPGRVVSPLEELIARQRAELMLVERNGASAITDTYKRVEHQLAANLKALISDIETARTAGVEVRPNWLVSQHRYQQLLAELQEETLAFIHRTIAVVTGAQEQAVERAPKDAGDLVVKALGPGSESAVAQVRHRMDRLPARQLERLVGFAGDGKPLGELLAELGPESAQAAKDSLAYGVASGQSPRVIASDVATKTGMTKTRALTIARTEMLRPYREVTAERFKTSQMVKTWTWLAVLDKRTCPMCAAMNGTIHSTDEELHTHPCCRCAQSPNTPSWADLGFAGIPDNRPPQLTPAERLAAIPEADRLAILGKARLDAYNAGQITLEEMVRKTENARWGPGRRTATLTELSLHA